MVITLAWHRLPSSYRRAYRPAPHDMIDIIGTSKVRYPQLSTWVRLVCPIPNRIQHRLYWMLLKRQRNGIAQLWCSWLGSAIWGWIHAVYNYWELAWRWQSFEVFIYRYPVEEEKPALSHQWLSVLEYPNFMLGTRCLALGVEYFFEPDRESVYCHARLCWANGHPITPMAEIHIEKRAREIMVQIDSQHRMDTALGPFATAMPAI
jgi:hypothetical protein